MDKSTVLKMSEDALRIKKRAVVWQFEHQQPEIAVRNEVGISELMILTGPVILVAPMSMTKLIII
jgi:hypothetical protein